MADEETPASSEDAGVTSPPIGFHLENLLDEGEIIVGFAGVLRYLDAEGDVCSLPLVEGVDGHTALGMLMHCQTQIMTELEGGY